MKRLFTKHPEENGMTYSEHFVGAVSFGFRSIKAGFMSLVHSVFPFVFEHNAGDEIEKLHAKLRSIRDREE